MIEGSHDHVLFDTLSPGELDGAVVFDIGGHIGYHAMVFAALVGNNGHVVTFEPNTSNADRMQAQLDQNPALAARISLEQQAIGDHRGEVDFTSASTSTTAPAAAASSMAQTPPSTPRCTRP